MVIDDLTKPLSKVLNERFMQILGLRWLLFSLSFLCDSCLGVTISIVFFIVYDI